MGGMEIRSAVAGAFATVAVAGLVFTAVAVSNAQEPAPVADQQATIATLTARLDAAEGDIASLAAFRIANEGWIVSLNNRVWNLENP